ncbi:polyphenol oxidase family protein [Magnetococcales bacterium HHB-1]
MKQVKNIKVSHINKITQYTDQSFPLYHGFFARTGGVSQAPFKTLNTAWRTEDPSASENRKRLISALNLNKKPLKILNPCHGHKIAFIRKKDWQNDHNNILLKTDAAFTQTPESYLLLSTADCLPVLVTDKKHRFTGVIHLGWRNIVDGFVDQVIEAVQKAYSTHAEELRIAIGPAIYPCCYRFRDPIQKNDPFWQPFLEYQGDNHYSIDLISATCQQLKANGIPDKMISHSHLCTSCLNDQFFSCYKEGYQSGRFATIVGMRS